MYTRKLGTRAESCPIHTRVQNKERWQITVIVSQLSMKLNELNFHLFCKIVEISKKFSKKFVYANNIKLCIILFEKYRFLSMAFWFAN